MPQESQTATHFSFTDGEAVLEASIIHPQFLQDYPGTKDIRRQSQDWQLGNEEIGWTATEGNQSS